MPQEISSTTIILISLLCALSTRKHHCYYFLEEENLPCRRKCWCFKFNLPRNNHCPTYIRSSRTHLEQDAVVWTLPLLFLCYIGEGKVYPRKGNSLLSYTRSIFSSHHSTSSVNVLNLKSGTTPAQCYVCYPVSIQCQRGVTVIPSCEDFK